jgi:pyruvate/2-oxoglutarate dehydrogenase complex dihydrolipoamide acyltransferase (E2) component
MQRDLLMPKLGLTMAEGLIIEWKVAPGQPFAKGEILLVVETEKIAVEIEAEFTGMMAEILVLQGSIAPVGSVIARWRATADTEEASRRSGFRIAAVWREFRVRPSAVDHSHRFRFRAAGSTARVTYERHAAREAPCPAAWPQS